MIPRQPTCRIVATVALTACASPESTPADFAAMQLAAATEIVSTIASNPGPITLVCVGYAGGGARPALPSVAAPSPAVAGMDGCVEREGRLVSADGGGQAISVTVGAPEPSGHLRGRVSVLTSTGAVDLAAYACSVRHRDGAWRTEGCALQAIS